MTFLQLSTTWLRTERLDERGALPFPSPISPRKAEPPGNCTGCSVLREKPSPHLNDTAKHRKLNDSWGRDINNYLQNTHKLFQKLLPSTRRHIRANKTCSPRTDTGISEQTEPAGDRTPLTPAPSIPALLRLHSITHLGPGLGRFGRSLCPFSPRGSRPGFRLPS